MQINGRIVAEALAEACGVKLAEEGLLMYTSFGSHQKLYTNTKEIIIPEEQARELKQKSVWVVAESNILIEGKVIPEKEEPPMRIVTYKCKKEEGVKVFKRLVIDPKLCNKIADAINSKANKPKQTQKVEETPTFTECLKFLFGKED